MRRVPQFALWLGLAAVILSVGCQDSLRQPVAPRATRRVASVSGAPGCQTTCVVADNVGPLRAATPVHDSSAAFLGLGSELVVGAPGDEIALQVQASDSILDVAGETTLLVRVGGVSTEYTVRSLTSRTVVYRFADTRAVHVSFALARTITRPVPDAAFQISQWTGDAGVARVNRPWSLAGNFAGLLTPSDCAITQASQVVCGDPVAVSPFSAPTNIGGTFTSQGGTGASTPITITFVFPAQQVTGTIHDPTFAGNSMTALDSAGGQIGFVSFAFSGVPGDNIMDTQSIQAHGIRLVNLTPAAADYVSYDVTFQLDTLCSSTGDSVLNNRGFADSLRNILTRSNPDSAPGVPNGKKEHLGIVWKMSDSSYLGVDYPNNTTANECSAVFNSNPSPPVGAVRAVAFYHAHPAGVNDKTYGCQPGANGIQFKQSPTDPNGQDAYGVGDANGGGSDTDWDLANVPPNNHTVYVINKDGSIWRLDPGTPKTQRPSNPNHWNWNTPNNCFTKAN